MVNLLALACLLSPVQQTDRAAAATELLPPSTAAVIELNAPVEFLKSLMDHPIHERAKQDKVLAQLYASPQMFQARAGLAMGELALGMKWPDAVKTLAGSGITVAFDPETNGVVAVLKSGDPQKLPALVQTLLKLANDQRLKNNQAEIETGTYRDVAVYKIDKSMVAKRDDMLLLTNERKLGKWVLDSLLDGNKETLTKDETFGKYLAAKDRTDSVTAFLNLNEVRKRGGMDELLKGTKSNVFAEFLLGGILEALSDAPFVSAGLKLDDTSLRLAANTPHDPASISEQREFYFGPKGTGRAPERLAVDSGIGNVAVYRDVSKMWLYAGDLFDQKVNDGFAEAETGLSTLFAGKDFVEEILGEIKPDWQLVFARQDFANVLPRPAVKFPSFALVGELKDSTKMNPELKRTFQSMIGFFNVVGAMEGNPQMEMDMMSEEGVKYLTAAFVPSPEDKESTEATVHFNFAPSLALGKNRFVLSSSLSLAKQTMAAAAKPVRAAAEAVNNFEFRLEGDMLAKILGDNRGQLISNNMLEDGNTRKEAEQQIDVLLGIVSWFDNFSATLQPAADQLKLQLELSLRE